MLSNNKVTNIDKIPLLDKFFEEESIRFPAIGAGIFKILYAMSTGSSFMKNNLAKFLINKGKDYPVDFNASGDAQVELDVMMHQFFVNALGETDEVCAVLSEEAEHIVHLKNTFAPYIVTLDPLDGSANIAVSAPIGTLFSIYKRKENVGGPLQTSDVLMPGKKQLAAGYILYNAANVFVYATAYGVNIFVYHPEVDCFFLNYSSVIMPENGPTYSVNDGYLNKFPNYIQTYINQCRQQELSSRYTGALVADFHRHLMQGGIFLYPPTFKRPNGKLRLLFECNTLAFIALKAGGLASDGKQDILEIIPHDIHQTVPLYIGSKKMVETLLAIKLQQ